MDLVSSKKPDFLFLMETKVARVHAERLRVKLGFDGLFYVDSVGLSGGLALFWRRNCTARLLCYSRCHIDVEVSVDSSACWRMTCFYGYPERSRRAASWDFLRSLAGSSDLPWVILGDFNDLLFQHEKRGGNPHPDALLRGFGEALDDCGLTQLPLRGYQFTWERGKGTTDWLEERLDKVLADDRWRCLQEGAIVENILTRSSDHSALFLRLSDNAVRQGGLRRAFKFEMAWLLDEGCRGVVEHAWQLRLRGRRDPESLAEFQRLENQLTRLEAQEDTFWRQRAKQHWLKGADANTRFYHRYASARKKKNSLSRLKNDAGVWVEGEALEPVVLSYFNHIFHSTGSALEEPFFSNIAPRVSQADNDTLLRPFEISEVKETLFSMFPDKAPGPDGMNPGFYQHYWDVVGGDVTEFVINCLQSCSFPEGLNATNVVLIPKKKVPESVADLRPIALCNVVYKIMAKVLANRLKPLLDNLISESQSAFIPNRLITDNILIAAEIGHYLNRKQGGLAGWGALKLDMAKAYDRMEWHYLRRMMEALGFAPSFVINGVPTGNIIPSHGLRQGDPLSPYLFIICAEGLSLLLQKAQVEGSIKGCRVARGAPPVSHLFFADDSLLFFRANAQEAGAVKHCLDLYESMSGQAVNYHKSSVCFSRNTQEMHRVEVAAVLGITQAPNFGKYLGLPAFVGRNRRAALSYIEDKIKQRIGSWNKKLLSQAGKEILLKSVAQAMPTFSMSVFLLPESVCLSIERTMNRFWWGSGTERRIHWKAWDRLCIPKKFGGLGFKDLRVFNLAMLGKQAWRFLTMPNSLVARIYKARYYPKTSFIDAAVGNCPSFCWRSIMAAHNLICSGARRRIGDGKSTLIWGHSWLPDDPSPMVHTTMPANLNGTYVSGLIDEESGTWDISILNDIFTPEDVLRISRVPVSSGYEDIWFWHGDPKGCYTVKSGYKLVMGEFSNMEGDFDDWTALWKLKVPPKWKTFLWRALSDTLPVTTSLLIRRVDVDPACPKCASGGSFSVWLSSLFMNFSEGDIRLAVAALYYTWRARNSAVWDGLLPLPRRVTQSAKVALQAWTAVHHNHAATAVHTSAHADPEQHQITTPKCFFDASFMPNTLRSSFGAVLLSPNGVFMAACAGPLPDCLSPLMAEVEACKMALTWLSEKGLESVALLTDCSQLRSQLSQDCPNRSYTGLTIQTCKALRASFHSCVVTLVPRLNNVIAHTLAKSVVSQTSILYWDSVPPNSIFALLH
ncbi:uncharacterized protein LOC116020159 [Ipomoea triloba]|uniref:uncharacterized protein LOC116020159 n=1 Tax=Ipomoea triloba TaxID=35885 RepID=UPI00125D1846|nr:uncharacterized protein LOC116020159 [Ipomoea triloba]